ASRTTRLSPPDRRRAPGRDTEVSPSRLTISAPRDDFHPSWRDFLYPRKSSTNMRSLAAVHGNGLDPATDHRVELLELLGGNPELAERRAGGALLRRPPVEGLCRHLEAKDVADVSVPGVPVAGDLRRVLLGEHG